MITLTLPDNYGNVIALALGGIPLLGFLHGATTIKTRKAANIPLPHSYASIEQCKADPRAERFNSAQRAHSNFLENATQTMLFTLVAGLKYPNMTTVLASTWVVFRGLYLYGYVYSGKPEGRGRTLGTPAWFAQIAMWGMSVFGVAWPAMGSILGN